MPRTSNVYAAPSSSFNPAVQGEPIDMDDWNSLLTDLVAGLNSSPVTASYVGNTVRPWVSLVCVNGANTDLTLPTGTNFYITGPTSTFSITGLTGGADGREITLYNTVAYALTLTNEATSAAANQITTLTGSAVSTTTQGMITLVYDGTASKWIVKSVQA